MCIHPSWLFHWWSQQEFPRGEHRCRDIGYQMADEEEARSVSSVVLKHRLASCFLCGNGQGHTKLADFHNSWALRPQNREEWLQLNWVLEIVFGLFWAPDCLGIIQEGVNWPMPVACLEPFCQCNKGIDYWVCEWLLELLNLRALIHPERFSTGLSNWSKRSCKVKSFSNDTQVRSAFLYHFLQFHHWCGSWHVF